MKGLLIRSFINIGQLLYARRWVRAMELRIPSQRWIDLIHDELLYSHLWSRPQKMNETYGRLKYSTPPPPKDIHTLVTRTCNYFTFHGKRDFAGVIKLKILRWVRDTGLSRWAKSNTTVIIKGRQVGQSERGDVRTEAEVTVMWPQAKEECRLSLETGGNGFSSRASRRKLPCRHLDISSVKAILELWPPGA